MVLESLASKIDSHPNWKFLGVGAVYFSIALLLSIWKFKMHIAIFSVFLTVLAAFPFFYYSIKKEEEYDEKHRKEFMLLKSHARPLRYFMFFFIGIVLVTMIWFLVLPSGVALDAFQPQMDAIDSINNSITGSSVRFNTFMELLSHNFEILVLCLVFSFIYGAGALLILTWNATVIGVAAGSFIKARIAETTSYLGLFSYAVLQYAIHGIPEILAFFTAGLAGGIISVAVIKHHFLSRKSQSVLVDSYTLIVISVMLLIIAAFLEAYITPLLFP